MNNQATVAALEVEEKITAPMPTPVCSELERVSLQTKAFCLKDEKAFLLVGEPTKQLKSTVDEVLSLITDDASQRYIGIVVPFAPHLIKTDERKAQQKALTQCLEKIQSAGLVPFALLPENTMLKVKDETIFSSLPLACKRLYCRFEESGPVISKKGMDKQFSYGDFM